MLKSKPNYIIAIGASAGGLDEINLFFDHTPLDGVSYVIVQHLSAEFKSRMVELLSRHSKLVVKEAQNSTTVYSNEVYLIPNDKFMTIREGRLHLTEKEKVAGPHLTINSFFNSLAADAGGKAIAVVLSGLGSDGTEGIRSIKKAGGMVIARNPETSAFPSMPSNAIATGMVDFILEPELMPDAIEDYVKHEEELLAGSKDDEALITAITNLIKEKSPLDFTDYKKTTILRRTKRRAAYSNCGTLKKYLELLKENPQELEALAKDFLISVTSFFRDKEAFHYIGDTIFPALLAKHLPGEELKLWVAGCATGEEVYSLAILLCEQLENGYKDIVIKIFATDIDSEALAHAGRAVYGKEIEKDVSPDRLEKCFTKEGDHYKIKPDIRRMVIFAQHDLVKNPPYCNMDFVSCRNLLIYMTPVLQKKIFNILLFGLKLGGYLFLGSSENPTPIMEELEVINKKWRIYKNIKTRRAVSFEAFNLPELLEVKRSTAQTRELIAKNITNSLAETMNTEIASALGYVAVCVDEHHQVIKFYGHTSRYLLQENFNTDLSALLPKSLAIAYHTLIAEAGQTGHPVKVNGIAVSHNQAQMNVDLSVSPVRIRDGDPALFLVVFTESSAVVEESAVFDEKIYHDRYTQNLELEVRELKAKLSSAYELLDASNENMQSFNEELISANEEMQSTNEEMQSVNEELHTINADYQLKNKELMELNDNLNNYFRSNINGQLFVDSELLLMKFSPGSLKLINLLETDIGRPLSNISTNIKLDTIIPDIRQVIAEGAILSKEIEATNGRWYQVMTMPYIQQADNQVNGAIITFNDVTELKKALQEVDKKNASLMRINADLDNFAHATSHDLLGPLNNIELSIGTINRRVTDPEMQRFLTIINSSVKKFSTMIKEIGTVAKIENDRLASEMIDLDELINNIEWSLENKIEITGAALTRDFAVLEIHFSKKNLRSILYNLISNAIKFRSELPPVITLRTFMDEGEIVLTVEDNGKGIPASGLQKIFDLYGRLETEVEGSGIGLYLARKMINAAGGSMAVESEIGKGSKFTLRFKNGEELNEAVG
ncbi:chemotaxis protein CheB [Mucilaginibacter sp. L3T2-6]|uniref:chemotaxis protein CheB n=1 Tax=Mucilaginibacter sp. L3T2-6 TaxID=3062491 RepID=UPI0026748BB0|nr:chemotaxis protein CheB [Mucilaginibacter sp. L3T2-6]MDO3645264.1 chemotaxis protein CheB [Mucilaginibacter sp. L3T2-6]MDV6217716.1 chemotaxis protein CheB [Mucilaginibacter sp. L3T2-6]